MKEIGAKMTISRWRSFGGPIETGITLSIQDESSGITYLEIELTPEQLGLVLTGETYMPVKAKLRGLEFIGMAPERKTETITFDCDRYKKPDAEQIREKAKDFEVDGWKASTYIGRQGQIKWHDDGADIEIYFTRYVSK